MSSKSPDSHLMKLAHSHLSRDPNDKSFRHLSRMRRTYGSLRTTQTLKKVIETYGLVFPELMDIIKAHDSGESYPKIGDNINIDRIMLAEPFYQYGGTTKAYADKKQINTIKSFEWF